MTEIDQTVLTKATWNGLKTLKISHNRTRDSHYGRLHSPNSENLHLVKTANKTCELLIKYRNFRLLLLSSGLFQLIFTLPNAI